MRIKWSLVALLSFGSHVFLSAQEIKPFDYVTVRQDKTWVVKAGEAKPLEMDLSLNGITVSTNGVATLSDKSELKLQPEQKMTLDGLLISGGGLIPPVNHVAVQAGKVLVCKLGVCSPAALPFTFSNGMRIDQSGALVTPGGKRIFLRDGHRILPSGTPIPGKDYVWMTEGKLKVQKDGSLLSLQPNQIIVMGDGTRVSGEGKIDFPTGRSVRLQNEQILTLQGMPAPQL